MPASPVDEYVLVLVRHLSFWCPFPRHLVRKEKIEFLNIAHEPMHVDKKDKRNTVVKERNSSVVLKLVQYAISFLRFQFFQHGY